jgi:hypothetical protein
MKTANEVLTLARSLLVDVGWTQGSFGRTATGMAVCYSHPRAIAYCALGALYAADEKTKCLPNVRLQAETALRNQCPHTKLVIYNDNAARTKEDIIALYDKAIEATR